MDGNSVLGWHWYRHEIENYLLDPLLVEKAMEWSQADFSQAIVAAAARIRDYQVARWVVGTVRSGLPPSYELPTRPDTITAELGLPDELDADACLAWVRRHIDQYRRRVDRELSPEHVEELIGTYAAILTDSLLSSGSNALIWFSGKDLLAALEPDLVRRGMRNAGDFRARVRDWVSANPDLALSCVPEWTSLVAILRA